MARKKILVGGESNSGKSTFVLSLVECLQARGHTAEAVEFDVWSNSYPAFRGEVEFEKRPKRFDLKWNWRQKLNKRIHQFNESTADFAFGDMPGVLGLGVTHMCRASKADGVIVICTSLPDLKRWVRLFKDDFDIPILQTFLSSPLKFTPVILPDTHRRIDPRAEHVRAFARQLVSCKRRCKQARTRRKTAPRKARRSNKKRK